MIYSKLSLDEPELPSKDQPPSYNLLLTDQSQSQSQSNSILSSSCSPPELNHSSNFNSAPTNFLSINKQFESIKGEFTLDTSLLLPDDLPQSSTAFDRLINSLGLDQIKTRLTAEFITHSGINIDLNITGGRIAKIKCKSDGKAVVNLRKREKATAISLSISSNGPIRVSLPSDFRGIVKGGTQHGNLKFSPEFQKILTIVTVSQTQTQSGRYYLGNIHEATLANGQGEQSFEKDELVINSTFGEIIIETSEERLANEVQEAIERQQLEDERLERERERERIRSLRGSGVEGWSNGVLERSGDVFVSLWKLVEACFGADL